MFKVLFEYGPFTLKTFNIFLGIAFTFNLYFLVRYTLRKKMNISFFSKYAFKIALVALITGRVFFIIENVSLFLHEPWSALFIWDLKFSFFGIVYGALFMLFMMCHREQENFWVWLDGVTLAGLISLFFISLGHFFNGTNYGSPTTLPWGITFDTFEIPFITPIHPTQLYQALGIFLIFSYLMSYNKRHHQPGEVGTIGIMMAGMLLLGIDFLHGLPSMYVKINAGLLAIMGFGGLIYCTHLPSPLSQNSHTTSQLK